MTPTSKTSGTQGAESKRSFLGSASLFGFFSLFFLATSFLFSCFIFYHATLSVDAQLIRDKATLYKTGMLSSLPLTENMSSDNIAKVHNFISALKSEDRQLRTVMVFTKDGFITYSSTLGLIGDHIMDRWQDFLAQDPMTPEILGERDLSLLYFVPSKDGLYIALIFEKESFWALVLDHIGLLIFTGLSTLGFGLYLFGRHIFKLKGYDFQQDPLLNEFEQRQSVVRSELNELSKDLKNYESL